jgi:hypothetical protein
MQVPELAVHGCDAGRFLWSACQRHKD